MTLPSTAATSAGSTLITAHGSKLDSTQAKNLNLQVDIALTHHSHVVLDLRTVQSVAPEGWNFLLATQQRVLAQNGTLTVCNLRPAVRQIFEMVGLHRVIACYSTPAAAFGMGRDVSDPRR